MSAINFMKIHNGIGFASQSSTPSTPASGDFYFDASSSFFKGYTLGAFVNIVGDTLTQTLSNKTISGSNNVFSNIADSALSISYIKADGSRALSASWNAGAFQITANSVQVGSAANTISQLSTIINTGTLTLPTSTDTLVGRATMDTLTNKTISGSSNTLSNIADSSLSNSYLYANGSRALSANWSAGSFSATFNSVQVGSAANTISGLATIVNSGTLTLPTSTDTLVGRATTDTLTNKTISGSSNTLSNIADGSLSSSYLLANGTRSLTGPLTQTQQTTPSNPSAGSNKLYFKSDNKLYTLNSSGTEVALGTASGSVTGPGSSTNNAIATWNGTSGTTLQNTPVTIDSSGNITITGPSGNVTLAMNVPSGNVSSITMQGRQSSTNATQSQIQGFFYDGTTNRNIVNLNFLNTSSSTASAAGGELQISTSGTSGTLTQGFLLDQNQNFTLGSSNSTGHTINGTSLSLAPATGNTQFQVNSGSSSKGLIFKGGAGASTDSVLALFGGSYGSGLNGVYSLSDGTGVTIRGNGDASVSIGNTAGSNPLVTITSELNVSMTNVPFNSGILLNGTNTSTSGTVYGFLSELTSNSSQTSAVYGYYAGNTTAASTTVAFSSNYQSDGINVGSSGTVTRFVDFHSSGNHRNATNNFVLWDCGGTFTVNYFLFKGYSIPSFFSG